MADAEDLKSSGDFSSCGFDSHPGHHFTSRVVPVTPGFRLRAQTPAKRLKFDSYPEHHCFSSIKITFTSKNHLNLQKLYLPEG